MTNTLRLSLLLLFAFPLAAFAQVPDPESNPLAVAGLVAELFQAGKALPAVMLGLYLAVWAFRKFALKLIPGAAGEWLRGKVGGYVVNLVFAVLGGLGTALYAGTPFSLTMLLGVLGASAVASMSASGFHELGKDLSAPKVDSIEAAVLEFNKKGPTP